MKEKGIYNIIFSPIGFFDEFVVSKKPIGGIDQNQLVFSTSRLRPLLTLYLMPIERVVFPRPNGEYSS